MRLQHSKLPFLYIAIYQNVTTSHLPDLNLLVSPPCLAEKCPNTRYVAQKTKTIFSIESEIFKIVSAESVKRKHEPGRSRRTLPFPDIVGRCRLVE